MSRMMIKKVRCQVQADEMGLLRRISGLILWFALVWTCDMNVSGKTSQKTAIFNTRGSKAWRLSHNSMAGLRWRSLSVSPWHFTRLCRGESKCLEAPTRKAAPATPLRMSVIRKLRVFFLNNNLSSSRSSLKNYLLATKKTLRKWIE